MAIKKGAKKAAKKTAKKSGKKATAKKDGGHGNGGRPAKKR
jgi:hypothetical protein